MREWLFGQLNRERTKSVEEERREEAIPRDSERILGNAINSFIAAMQARKFAEVFSPAIHALFQKKVEIVGQMVETAEHGKVEEQVVPLLLLELAVIKAREAVLQIEHRGKSMYEDEDREVSPEEPIEHLFESSKREEFLRLMDAIRSRADVVEHIYTRGDFMEWLGEVRKKLIHRVEAMKLDEGQKEALEDRIEAVERFLKKESGGEDLLIMVLREDINDVVRETDKRLLSVLLNPQSRASQDKLPTLLEELLKREQFFEFLGGE